MSVENNQREYYRIDDDVFLHVKKINDEEVSDTAAYFDTFRQSTILTAQFHQQRTAMASVLREIDARDAAVAKYIAMLSNQVDILAKRLLTRSIFASNEPLQSVNISAEGMRFQSSEAYQAGDKLQMIYALFPGGEYIPVLAEVIRTEPGENGRGYQVSVRNINMNDDDRELVIHHILFLERKLLQQKRLAG